MLLDIAVNKNADFWEICGDRFSQSVDQDTHLCWKCEASADEYLKEVKVVQISAA